MTENRNTGRWQITSDHDEVRAWADRHGAVPVDRGEADTVLGLERDPDADPIGWERFFEVFDREELVLRYREGAGEHEADHGILGREDLDPPGSHTEPGREPLDDKSERMALSDTGDVEPPAEKTDAKTSADEPRAPEGPSADGPSADREGEASTASIGDKARGSSGAGDLVLDTVHEHRPGMGDAQDEHVTFENAGDEPLDLSGWVVRNGADRTYRFPDGATLAPGDQVRLHSGEGRDVEGDYYWNATEPVWETRGDTVVVERPDGEVVLETDYKGGRAEPS